MPNVRRVAQLQDVGDHSIDKDSVRGRADLALSSAVHGDGADNVGIDLALRRSLEYPDILLTLKLEMRRVPTHISSIAPFFLLALIDLMSSVSRSYNV